MPEASKQSIAQTSDESKRTDEPVKKTVRFQLSESRRNQSELQKESRELERQRRALKEERANWQESNEVLAIEEKKKPMACSRKRARHSGPAKSTKAIWKSARSSTGAAQNWKAASAK